MLGGINIWLFIPIFISSYFRGRIRIIMCKTIVSDFWVTLLKKNAIFCWHWYMHRVVIYLSMCNTFLGMICLFSDISSRVRIGETREMTRSLHILVILRLQWWNSNTENTVDGVKLNTFIGSKVSDESKLLSLDVLDRKFVVFWVDIPK